MIKINQLNKYYNKNRRNENHVLKDVSVDFPEKGMVMLLGDSGSGKTTLLNIIGGLDKADQGAYAIGDETIEKYQAKTVDDLRNKNIGYIFQNYYLFPQETVFENIRLTLKLVGLNDEEEINQRVNSLLKLVNMPQYKHRLANQLSGGQQQRIAIIRALAKNPKIIIADEPTGNLDSKNTLAIMRMLKEISKEKLIIMVTHEETIASHYGDQIIKIEDGKILSHGENGAKSSIDTTTDSDIYLGDLEKKTLSMNGKDSINLYTDGSEKTPINARLIIKNNTLYIDIDGAFKNINLLKEKTDTKVYESKREEIKEQEDKLPSIDYEPFKKDELSSNKNIIPFKTIAETTLRKLKQSSKLSKLLYLSFAFSAGIFIIALALINNILFISNDQFLSDPLYTFEVNYEDFEDYDAFIDHEFPATFEAYQLMMNSSNSMALDFTLPRFYQTSESVNITESFAPISLVDERDLIKGSMPSHPREIVISSTLARQMLNNNAITRTGIQTEDDLFKLTYTFDGEPYSIQGIVDNDAPVYFGEKALMYSTAYSGEFDIASLYDLTILSGRDLESRGETLLPSTMVSEEDFEPHEVTLLGETFNAVGVYETTDNMAYMISETSFEAYLFNRDHQQVGTFYLYANSESSAGDYLESLSLSRGFDNLYETQRSDARNERMDSFTGIFIFSIITIAASALSYYFIIRSSMLNRIYEIGVYRSLGVKRFDLIKMFWIEILILTTLSSLIGYTLMFFFLRYINEQTREFIEIMNLSVFTYFSGFVLLYLINSLFGLLPLFRVLSKTPAEINSTYDL